METVITHSEGIAVLDFSRGEVYVFQISKNEESEHFLDRKGFRLSDIEWMRGNIKVLVEHET